MSHRARNGHAKTRTNPLPSEISRDQAPDQAFVVERVTRIELALSAWEVHRPVLLSALTCEETCP
jgi:hypothetical protein